MTHIKPASVGRLLSVALAGGCLLVSTACGSSSTDKTAANPPRSAAKSVTPAKGAPLPVVAGENFWGSIAQQIGGSHVTVTSIITNPNTDPHEYETDPRDAAAVTNARFIIENGVGYDDFLVKQVKGAGGSKRVLNIQQLVGVTGDDANPHLWYSPSYVKQAASAIEKQLESDDPAHSAEFKTNLDAFLTAYQPYLDTIAEIKKKYNGEAISYTERVAGYLVDAAGLHLGTPASFSQAVEDDTDPTPQDTAQFNADIKEHKVKVLLYNGQVTDDQSTKIKQTATSADVPIVPVTETIPNGQSNFQSWQIAQAKALLSALGG